MEKFNRRQRIAILLKTLCDNPGKVFTLGSFGELLNSAKTSVSEDIVQVQEVLNKFQWGTIESISGPSGGIKFIPGYNKREASEILRTLCDDLSSPHRILPGDYLYTLDIICNPLILSKIGSIFAGYFYNNNIDYVITVETKGIPLAYETAKNLNVPLVVVRRNIEVADGASVSINYVSGSSNNIQTMVLSLRSIKRGSKLLFIDDFMKGGGTAKGIIELASEFESEVAGIGVLIETCEPSDKLVSDYSALFKLKNVCHKEKTIEIVANIDKFCETT